MWTYEELASLKEALNDEGLHFYAIENFEVEHWYDVLLDGPQRDAQMDGLQELLRTMGRLGIEVMGYNFSYANVWGRVRGPYARGGARTPAYIAARGAARDPHPQRDGLERAATTRTPPPGDIGEVSGGAALEPLRALPEGPGAGGRGGQRAPGDAPRRPAVGHACGARPAWSGSRSTTSACFDLYPSHHNCAEFCQGTIAEMDGEMDVYEAIERLRRAEEDRLRALPQRARARCRTTSRSSSTPATWTWSGRCGSTTSTASTAC